MTFNRFDPDELLKELVECYWIAEDNDPTPILQKIIPDGFPEIIFHYGDPYKIKLGSHWEIQSSSLFAGQISKHFYLENTGRSGMVGIKFKPAVLSYLFNLRMVEFTDTVLDLKTVTGKKLEPLEKALRSTTNHFQMITILNSELRKLIPPTAIENTINKAAEIIFSTHGMISIRDICIQMSIKERQLQRLFNTYIGLSPKFYSRVIRFSYIFQLAQEKKLSWTEVGLESGFYDQPHFIKNFKAFTGEDPSRYFFDEPSLANFFLNK